MRDRELHLMHFMKAPSFVSHWYHLADSEVVPVKARMSR